MAVIVKALREFSANIAVVRSRASNRQVFALPKGRKTRTVPLPESVKDELAAHLTRYPAKRVSLPWETIDGDPVEVPLVL